MFKPKELNLKNTNHLKITSLFINNSNKGDSKNGILKTTWIELNNNTHAIKSEMHWLGKTTKIKNI